MFDSVENPSQINVSSDYHHNSYAVDTAFLSISLADCIDIGLHSEEWALVDSVKMTIWDNLKRRQLYLARAAIGNPQNHAVVHFTPIPPERFQELHIIPPPLLPMINLLVNPGSFQHIWEMAQHLQDMVLKIQACIEEVKYRCQVLGGSGIQNHSWSIFLSQDTNIIFLAH
jgi:hypothetical protein